MDRKSKLLLIGGGGHCKSILDSVLETNCYEDIRIVDVKENIGKSFMGVSIIGCDDDLESLIHNGFTHAFVSLGSIGIPIVRIKLFEKLERIGYQIPNIIDFSAVVSKHALLAKGIFIGKNAVINTGVSIGTGAIINTSATIEHECIIGEFAHIAPGSVLCGDVKVGSQTHIGAKSVVKQQIYIGSKSIIGMGSVVLHDVADNVVAYGNPCKEVKSL
jgi:sugar O-acyltransferase (sialic acid O-acetyltransferase NeuD family)